MNGQCSGRNCEVAGTCARFNPKIHAEAICGFGLSPDGHAVYWAPSVQIVVVKRAA